MTDSATPRYGRVVLKLSGESFARAGESGISLSEIEVICEQIRSVVRSGVQLAIVCGGGALLFAVLLACIVGIPLAIRAYGESGGATY